MRLVLQSSCKKPIRQGRVAVSILCSPKVLSSERAVLTFELSITESTYMRTANLTSAFWREVQNRHPDLRPRKAGSSTC